jgi:hypothetical protein
VYDPKSAFQNIAANVLRAVRYPMLGDEESLPEVVWPIPTILVILCKVSKGVIEKFIEKGCADIRVFASAETFDELTVPLDTGKFSVFDESVALFDTNTIYDMLPLTGGPMVFTVLEKALCACFPYYESEVCKREDGLALIHGMNSTGRDLGETTREIVHTMRGYELEMDLSVRGASLRKYHGEIVRERFAGATKGKLRGISTYFICAPELIKETVAHARGAIGPCEAALIYSPNKDQCGVTIVAPPEHMSVFGVNAAPIEQGDEQLLPTFGAVLTWASMRGVLGLCGLDDEPGVIELEQPVE